MKDLNKPIFTFLIGLPGSGKSTWAENNKDKLNAVVHSSDEIREELLNDINDQSQNDLVFNTLHKRIKEDLLDGKNVIYDATGLKRKNRLHLISNILKDVPCEKVCVLFATPYECCLKNNSNRERIVPEHVIERMYKNFEVPCKQEGWDDIQIVWYNYEKYGIKFNIAESFNEWRKITHDNPHHTLSIGDHMIAAKNHLILNYKYDYILFYATSLHDCGKPFVKDYHNSKNESTESAHFYQHHCCGSYDSLFYLNDVFEEEWMKFEDDEILHISLLIGLHMQPFLSWDKSEKAKEKDRKLFGDDVIKQVEILHECDLAAH